MMIIFLQDFRGVETREAYYRKGDEVDLDEQTAQRLILDGRAKAVKNAENLLNRNVQHRRRGNSDK